MFMSILENTKVTLLSKEDYLGNNKLKIIKSFGDEIEDTDLAKLIVLDNGNNNYSWTKTQGKDCKVVTMRFGRTFENNCADINMRIRPVLKFPVNIKKLFHGNLKQDKSGDFSYIYLGDYPQKLIDCIEEEKFLNILKDPTYEKTGRVFHINNQICEEYRDTIDSNLKLIFYKVDFKNQDSILFTRETFIPFEDGFKTADKPVCQIINQQYVVLVVEPVCWLIDNKTNSLVSKNNLLSGVRFNKDGYDGNFENTEMYDFLNNVMFRDIFQDYLPRKEEKKEQKDTILKMIKELLEKTEKINDENDRLNIANDLKKLAEFYTDELIKIRGNEPNKYGSERNLIALGIMPYYVYIESEINREISQDNKDKETLEINSIIDNLIEKASLIEDEDIRLDILSEIEELKTNYLEELNTGKTSYERIDFSKPLEKQKDSNGKEYMKYIQKLTLKPTRPVLIKELLAKEMAISKRIDKELANNSIRSELSEFEKYTDEIMKR